MRTKTRGASVFCVFGPMATATANSTAVVTAKRKPVFKKVDELKPGTSGHTLTVKVVSSKTVKVASKGSGRSSSVLMARPTNPSRIAECLVGDETGTIVFTARNDQGTYANRFVPVMWVIDFYVGLEWIR